MRNVSKRNQKRFPELHDGDKVVVIGSAISILNGARGYILEADKRGRSPYKSIHKCWLRGLPESGNPWYIFGNEIMLDDERRSRKLDNNGV